MIAKRKSAGGVWWIPIGEVTNVRAQIDLKNFQFPVPVTVQLDPRRLGVKVPGTSLATVDWLEQSVRLPTVPGPPRTAARSARMSADISAAIRAHAHPHR